MSNVQAQRTRIEQEALLKEQAELNLKMGSEKLKAMTMENEAMRKTLPIRIEQEYARLRQMEAETFMKEFDASMYEDVAKTDLEIKRMKLNAMNLEFALRARQTVTEEWAENFFKDQNISDKEIEATATRRMYTEMPKLAEMVQAGGSGKFDEYFREKNESLDAIIKNIEENNIKYEKTKDPRLMEENIVLRDIAKDLYVDIAIANNYIEENKTAINKQIQQSQNEKRDVRTETNKQINGFRELFDKYKNEYIALQRNSQGLIKKDPKEIELEATTHAINRISNSTIMRDEFPNAYRYYTDTYGTNDVGQILSTVFTGGYHGSKEFNADQLKRLINEFSDMGEQVYLDTARMKYTPEFENFLIRQVNEGNLDITAFNEAKESQRKVLSGNLSEIYKPTESTHKATPEIKTKITIEAHKRFRNMKIPAANMNLQDLNYIYANIYADVARENNVEPDLKMFLDYNPQLNTELSSKITGEDVDVYNREEVDINE